MMNTKLTYVILASAAMMASCGKSGTTSRDLQYKIHTGNKGEKIAEGDFVKFHVIYETDKDSVLQSTYEQPGQPAEAVIDSMSFAGAPLGQYMYDALKMLTSGDSATFKVKVDSLFSTDTVFRPGMTKPPRPPFLDSTIRFINMTVKVEEVKTKRQVEQELKEERDKQTKLEADTINQYISEHNLEVKQTPSGIRYQKTTETDGERPNSNDTVVVHYTGTLLDGTQFDSSYGRNEPVSFPLVEGALIEGWYQAIPLFKKGEKGILVIPSAYGYGEYGNPPAIPPNSPLVFELELVDIKKHVPN